MTGFNKQILWTVPVFTGLALGSFYATRALKRHVAVVHAESTLPPVRVDYVSHSAGSPAQFRRFTAVRSDGAWVLGRYLARPDGTEYLVRGITFPGEGKYVSVFGDINAIQTVYAGSSGFRGVNHDDPSTSCLTPVTGQYLDGRTLVGTGVLLGYRTAHIQYQAGGKRHDQWMAPDLGCMPLKDVLQTQSGEFVGEEDAVAVVPGEPDPALFAVPADYVEMSPSGADAAYEAKFLQGQKPDCVRTTETRRDLSYFKHHTRKP